MKLLLMGPQGCGKGTQGEKLSKYLDLPLISVGATLRAVPHSHPRHDELEAILNRGDLAPQDLTADLVKSRTTEPDCSNGYILDGWCRSMIDLKYFNPDPDYIIIFNISRDESVRRVSGRRMCSTDGKIYNIYTLPKEELAQCTGELVQRSDDTEEAVNKRLDIYYSQTQETINYFKQNNYKVLEIDGSKDPDQVFEDVLLRLRDLQSQ
jgi:adenylate kinase